MKNGISLFLNEEEKRLLNDNSKKAGITKSAYVREMINNKKYLEERNLLKAFLLEIDELKTELNKIGTNINQIAFALNAQVIPSENTIQKEINELKEILTECKVTISNLPKAKISKRKNKWIKTIKRRLKNG